jgi:hypothetical protein
VLGDVGRKALPEPPRLFPGPQIPHCRLITDSDVAKVNRNPDRGLLAIEEAHGRYDAYLCS